MTPSQKLRSIADSTGLDGIADAIREIANEIEHNNAPAVPQWNGACEAMKWLNEIELYQGGANGPTIKLRAAIQALAATPAPAPAQSFDEVWDSIDWNEWRMKSIRDLVQMIHSKTAPAPAQEGVGLTDEEIFKCVQAACLDGSCPDFETFTKQELEDPVLTDFARAIIAALRAKWDKL